MSKIISDKAIKRREFWIEEIRRLSGNFGNDTEKLEKELEAGIKRICFSIRRYSQRIIQSYQARRCSCLVKSQPILPRGGDYFLTYLT